MSRTAPGLMAVGACLLVGAVLLAGGCDDREEAGSADTGTIDRRIEQLRQEVDRATSDVRQAIQVESEVSDTGTSGADAK